MSTRINIILQGNRLNKFTRIFASLRSRLRLLKFYYVHAVELFCDFYEYCMSNNECRKILEEFLHQWREKKKHALGEEKVKGEIETEAEEIEAEQ